MCFARIFDYSYSFLGRESSDKDDESEDSGEEMMRNLSLPKTNGMGLSIADVIQCAATQSKIKVTLL